MNQTRFRVPKFLSRVLNVTVNQRFGIPVFVQLENGDLTWTETLVARISR